MVLAGVLLEALSDAAPKRAHERPEDFGHGAARLGWFVAELLGTAEPIGIRKVFGGGRTWVA